MREILAKVVLLANTEFESSSIYSFLLILVYSRTSINDNLSTMATFFVLADSPYIDSCLKLSATAAVYLMLCKPKQVGHLIILTANTKWELD